MGTTAKGTVLLAAVDQVSVLNNSNFNIPVSAGSFTIKTAAGTATVTVDPATGTFLLRVLEGDVRLVFHEPARVVVVTPDAPGEIPPQAWHHVEVTGPMRMQVEFYHEKPLGGAG